MVKNPDFIENVRPQLLAAGLPDGLFSNQKSQFGKILEGLRMENAGKLYCNLEYFTVICYILWPFGNAVVIWYVFPRFGILCREKSGNPGWRAKPLLSKP
jgi:hypothetical protein